MMITDVEVSLKQNIMANCAGKPENDHQHKTPFSQDLFFSKRLAENGSRLEQDRYTNSFLFVFSVFAVSRDSILSFEK